MKYFHYHNLIPYIDIALLDSETIVTNPKYAHIGYTFEDKPSIVAEKLYASSVVFIHPDSYDKWKNVLLLLTKRKQLPIKLFIFSGSDYYFDDDILLPLRKQFVNSEMWIQNYCGTVGGNYRILPIGVNDDYNDIAVKDYLFGISYASNTGGFREELIEYLNTNETMKQYCMPKVPQEEYFKLLSQFYYNVCPMGNGFDTLRFWETLMVGTIPIVKKHDFFDNLLFQYPQLPIIIVDSWNNLPKLIESLTVEEYNVLWDKADISVIENDYWISKVQSILSSSVL
jgi:hypothetical protein